MKLQSKILLVLVLLLVLGFIFLMPHGRYRHALEAYKKELIAKGEKLTIAELAPPPPPANASNGAKAFMQLMSNYRLPTNLPPAMRIVAPGLADVACTNLTSAEMLGYESNLGKVAKLRDILNASSVLEFNLDYSQGYGLLPHLTELKSAALLLTSTAAQASYAKNSSEARSDLLAAADLFRLYHNESIILSHLVRVNLARIALGATWESLQCDECTDPQLAELEVKWQEDNLFANAAAAIAVDRVWGMAAFDEVRKTGTISGVPFSDSLSGNFEPSGDDGMLGNMTKHINGLYGRARFLIWKASWSYDEELCYLQLEDLGLEVSRHAEATGAFVPEFQYYNQNKSNIIQLHSATMDHYLIISYAFGPSPPGGNLVRLAEIETARRLTVTAIALKRYHLQHGIYPANLNDLVPAFLRAVPADFMDGKPLRYKLRPDGDFLLYSVGEDGQDDGGDPSTSKSETYGWFGDDWLRGRDIVWPRVATPAALEEYHRLSQTTTNTPSK